MTSSKPYILRAIYEWLLDNQMTPHLLVDAEYQDVEIPRKYVQDGKIILNISPTAVNGLSLDNEDVTFSARFGGKPFHIYLPIASVLGIYSRENGQGTMFNREEENNEPDDDPDQDPPKKRPQLRVVK